MDEAISRYLLKHARIAPESEGLKAPGPGLRLVVVIPALAEREGIGEVLGSLCRGSGRLSQMEVIVVVNNAADAPREIVEDNLETLRELAARRGDPFSIWTLDRASFGKALDPNEAGVGAARRIGMDLALRRLVQAGCPERSAIACLDADSPVSSGYVDAVLAVFDAPSAPLAGICRCHHPLPGDPTLARAIVIYEIWLRYVEWGLRLCGSPYAFQTIGSCITTSPYGYALADGMPPRQAGEDFYFLQKIVKLWGMGGARGREAIRPVEGAIVHPAARPSHRVPFGTGRALRRCLAEGLEPYLQAEPPQAFGDLAALFSAVSGAFEQPERLRAICAGRLWRFVETLGGMGLLTRLRENSPDGERFARAVHGRFDSLQVVRYAHQCKTELGGVWLFQALLEVLRPQLPEEVVAGLPPLPSPADDLGQWVAWLEALRALCPPAQIRKNPLRGTGGKGKRIP